jgi:hypothetical protein
MFSFFLSSLRFFLIFFFFFASFQYLLAFIFLDVSLLTHVSVHHYSFLILSFVFHRLFPIPVIMTSILHFHYHFIYLSSLYWRHLHKRCVLSMFNSIFLSLYWSNSRSSIREVLFEQAVKHNLCSLVWLCSDPGNQGCFHSRTSSRAVITKVFSVGR